MSVIQKHINGLIELYFSQPKVLYEHLFGSYHQFVGEIIPYYLTQEPNFFHETVDKNIIYRHGFRYSNIRIKPSTWDSDNEIKFPSDCRKNLLNYFATVVADVQQIVEKIDAVTGEKTEKTIGEVERETQIANIPIMVRSKYCSTHIKQNLKGECKYDPGGYFIVNGKEKIVLSMEKMVDNKVLVFSKKDPSYENGIFYTAQINSRKNDWSDNLQILTLKNKKDGSIVISTSSQLVDVPLFILLRAMGIESDRDIISRICWNLDDIPMLNLLRASVNASTDESNNPIKTREEAIEYLITKLKRNRNISQTDEGLAKIQRKMYLEKILRQDLLPHLGEDCPKKIAFLGYMTNRLLNVILERVKEDDRDALHNKRIETPGVLLGLLFSQSRKKMLSEIQRNFKKKNQSDENPINVISLIKPSIIEQAIKTALATGIWGMNKTKKGVAQSLQRLSWIQGISVLRRVMSPSMEDAKAKITSVRMINNNQCSLLCFVESPEGAKIGIAKALSMTATITLQNSSQGTVVRNILRLNKNIKHPYDVDPLTLNSMVKIMAYGDWVGVCSLKHSNEIFESLKKARRENIIDKFTSISFDIKNKELRILYEGGRLIRPLLIVNDGKVNINESVIKDIDEEQMSADKTRSWKKLLTKYSNLVEYEDVESLNHLMVADTQNKLEDNLENKVRKIEYKESSRINRYGDYRYVNYTHSDFHSWLMLGTIASNIPFSDHNNNKGNVIHFAQAKQSIGIYLSSYKDRMDISQILYNPQVPICQTEGMKYNGCLDLPFGENAIVAITSYNGYNVEDAVIVNQSSIDRGIFRADSLKIYSSKIEKNPSTSQDDEFTKPDRNKVTGMKPGNYEKLNDRGFVPEETEIDDGDIIIGKVSPIQPTGDNNKVYKDNSVIFKSNVSGVIDRVHTDIYDPDGYQMYNVRVRMERKLVPGDKFTNMHGNKGTVGIIYPQRDMPFTESGMVPDMIWNPHGIPTRMYIAGLVETLASKEAAIASHFVDATPYNDYDVKKIPELLKKLGYSSYGTETMYCGLTGRKMDAQIFIGPSYTIRLKHMVLDKVFSRAKGQMQALTRQPQEGRARDGGLRIGKHLADKSWYCNYQLVRV